ncbi:hypothetical protein B0H13DRAFT_2104867 [Mycena leptocephala]|nr:hypothetical protein B0H13DRAFT_2104867 [Mycena leptocephala]
MARIPGIYHRLTLGLSLLYLVSGLTIIYLDGYSGFYIFPVICTVITAGMLLRLIPYLTYVDATNPLSRAGKHFVFVSFLMVNWVPPVLFRTFFQITGEHTATTPQLTQCFADRFLALRCIPIGMDLIFPFAIFATLMRASWTVYHRAIALHGEANVSLPPDIPHPANFFPFRFYPPGHEVPLWMLAHIADTERDEEAKSTVELV